MLSTRNGLAWFPRRALAVSSHHRSGSVLHEEDPAPLCDCSS